MRHVAIFGVGLIGGSFALALRRAGFTGSITGVSSPRTIQAALAAGVIDRAAGPEEAAAECDLIYLSQPVSNIIQTISQYGPDFRNDAVVTDAGSTKAEIADAAGRYVKEALFIGGHPMAGKETRGVEASDASLFDGRKYILSPLRPENAELPAFRELAGWIRKIGATSIVMDAATHDRMVAYTSHLPQLLSTALASVLSEVEGCEQVTGPAALEMTRLANSPFDIWHDIFSTNSINIQAAVAGLVRRLEDLKKQLDSRTLAAEFDRAAASARKLREKEFC